MTPQSTWIGIHNPQHPSAPICSATSPHYPTRRPDIGSSVTLVDEQHESIVVAIEQKFWPEEWIYLIRIEDKGQLPKILYTTLNRNSLKSKDNRIKPTALQPTDGDVAFFFNTFEKQTKVNVIQQSSSGFYETIRMVQPLLAQLSPSAIIQNIAGHRLFQRNESSSMDRHSDQTRYGSTERLESTPKPVISLDQTFTEAGPLAVPTGTVTSQDSQELLPPWKPHATVEHVSERGPRVKKGAAKS